MDSKIAKNKSWSCFKFKLELVLDMGLKFHTNVVKGLKIKVRKVWGLIPTFVEVTGEKLVGGPFYLPTISRSWIGWKKRFDNTKKTFKDDNIYPNQYMNGWEKLTGISEPEKEDF